MYRSMVRDGRQAARRGIAPTCDGLTVCKSRGASVSGRKPLHAPDLPIAGVGLKMRVLCSFTQRAHTKTDHGSRLPSTSVQTSE